MEQLQRDVARADERADAITFEIDTLNRALKADASSRLKTIAGEALSRARRARRLLRQEEALRKSAADGARKVEIRMPARGGTAACFDDGKWIELPPMVASLLRVLAYGAAAGADGFPKWQSFETVVEQLARKTGKKLSRHAVTQIVHRLRMLMTDSGVNRYLVQVDPRWGLRLLIRK